MKNYRIYLLAIFLSCLGCSSIICSESVKPASLSFCFDCLTFKDVTTFEDGLGSQELTFSCEEEMNLFFHNTFPLRSNLGDCEPSRNERIRLYTPMEKLNDYKYYLRLDSLYGTTQIAQYEFLAKSENYEVGSVNNQKPDLLLSCKIIVFKNHPFFKTNYDAKPVQNIDHLFNSIFIQLDAFNINKSYSKQEYPLVMPVYNKHYSYDSTAVLQKVDSIYYTLSNVHSWCCSDYSWNLEITTQLPLSKYHRSRTNSNSEFYVPMKNGEDMGVYANNNRDFFEIKQENLMIKVTTYYNTLNNGFVNPDYACSVEYDTCKN